MSPDRHALELAEALEHAYRLALALEGLAVEPGVRARAADLTHVLDQARATLLQATFRSSVSHGPM